MDNRGHPRERDWTDLLQDLGFDKVILGKGCRKQIFTLDWLLSGGRDRDNSRTGHIKERFLGGRQTKKAAVTPISRYPVAFLVTFSLVST